MKKIAILALPLLFPATSFANFAYVGVGIGAQMQRTSYEIQDSGSIYTINGSEQDAIGGLLAGYQYYYDESWFGACEIEGLAGESATRVKLGENVNTTAATARASFKRAGTFGAAIKVGRTIEKTSFYIRLGVEVSRFKATGNNSADVIIAADQRTINQNKTKAAFVPGLGIDFRAADRFIVGLDVRTAFYKATQFYGQPAPVPGNDITNFRTKFTPRMDLALITIKYLFK